jgi:hypothetical protein
LISCSFRGLGYVAILLLERLWGGLRILWKDSRNMSRDWLEENDELDGRLDDFIIRLVRAMIIGLVLVLGISLSYIVVWITQLVMSLF